MRSNQRLPYYITVLLILFGISCSEDICDKSCIGCYDLQELGLVTYDCPGYFTTTEGKIISIEIIDIEDNRILGVSCAQSTGGMIKVEYRLTFGSEEMLLTQTLSGCQSEILLDPTLAQLSEEIFKEYSFATSKVYPLSRNISEYPEISEYNILIFLQEGTMKYILLVLSFLIFIGLDAQQACNNYNFTENTYKAYMKIVETSSNARDYSGQTPIIRLSLNNVRDSNGNGGFSWVDIHSNITGLDEIFENRFCFTVIEENNIDDDSYFECAPGSISYNDLIFENDNGNAIRIYFVNGGGSGGFATGPIFELTGIDDVIDPTVYISDNFSYEGDVVNTFNPSSLAHEVGHTLGLFHTHEMYFGKENVPRYGEEESDDHVNCDNTGDLLCDTPADFDLQWLLNEAISDISTCDYFGNITDNNGVLYDPDTDNVMSYSHYSCRTKFTVGQLDRIENFLFFENYYDDYMIASNIEVDGTESEDRYYHADGSIYSTINHTDGNVEYVAREEIVLQNGFVSSASNSSTFSTRIADNLCHDELIANSGFIGNEIDERSSTSAQKHLMLFPNPAADQITVRLGESFSDYQTVILTNMQGERLEVLAIEIIDNQFTVDISGLNQGTYFLTVVGDNYLETKRFVKI